MSTLHADVYKDGTLAAELQQLPSGDIEFRYLPDYAGPSIATSLPVEHTTILSPNGSLPAFFTGLLPEGARLQRLTRRLKQSLSNELALLLAVGSDTPGDVQVITHGADLTHTSPLVHDNLEILVFDDLLSKSDQRALPGVQEKASASMISIPTRVRRKSPTSRQTCPREGIIKLSPPAYPSLIENEFQHLQAAKKLGIPVAQAELIYDSHDQVGLFIERFDRYCHNFETRRIAYEDASQVLNIPPALKYDVSTEDVIFALATQCPGELVARRNLFIQFLFAWISGNGDLHAKNASILMGHNGWEIAPMYDLPCTLVYGDDEMALSIQGKKKKLTLSHWRDLAETLELPQRALPRIFDRILHAATSVNWEALPVEGSVRRAVDRELASRRRQLEKFLNEVK